MRRLAFRRALLLATSVAAAGLPVRARADDGSQLSSIERQIKALQAELQHMKRDMAVRNEQMRAVQQQAAHAQAAADARNVGTPPAYSVPPGYALVPATQGPNGTVVLAKTAEPEQPKLPMGTFMVGGVRVTLGGFIEAAGIFRSRNEAADIASSFSSGIPLPNAALYHENEYRQSARQSRFSVMAQDNPDPVTTLTAFVEADLISAAPTANSNESNSYNFRVRHAYAVYDRTDWDAYFLGGQTWSLAVMDKKGIGYMQSAYNIPSQIDAQYIPGFVWTRAPQFRVAKGFADDKVWLAASIENPQTVYYAGPNGAYSATLGTINDENPGGSTFYSGTNYSTEVAPDVLVKAAVDPGFGHYEVFGIGRFLHNRISEAAGKGESDSKTVLAGGIGGGMILPIIPDYLNFQVNALTGRGVGRYATSGLSDAVIGPDGTPDPLSETMGLVGLVGHPIKAVDIYAYGGTERVGRKYFDYDGKAYGYGNPLYNNTSCETELGAAADCVANTKAITQGTIGAWWRFVHGPYGTMQVGPQYSYTKRSIFSGVGPTPKTDENMIFLSFRYYPFQ